VNSLTTVRVKWEKNEKGAWLMEEVAGSEEEFKVKQMLSFGSN
jgi:hypothetical protein